MCNQLDLFQRKTIVVAVHYDTFQGFGFAFFQTDCFASDFAFHERRTNFSIPEKSCIYLAQILLFDNLSDVEKNQYIRAIDSKLLDDSKIYTAQLEGEIRGEKIGLEKGEAKTLERIVVDSKNNGFSLEQIQLITKLTAEQIAEILKQHRLT